MTTKGLTEPETWAPKSTHERASDRLLRRIATVGSPICVGLDPVLAKSPKDLLRRFDDATDDALAAGVLQKFCLGALEALRDIVPVIKVQASCFERHGGDGMRAMNRVLVAARDHFEVILDFKRGDSGSSARDYAHVASHAYYSDWCTVNPYLGMDGIAPFVGQATDGEWHGAFALVRTSNSSGDAVQSLGLQDGRTVCQAVADMVAQAGQSSVGELGYSDLGAMVCTANRDEAYELRKRMPQQIFLMHGCGEQGGRLDDALPCFNADGRGAIITASESVLYAFEPTDADWQESVGRAAREFHEQVAHSVRLYKEG